MLATQLAIIDGIGFDPFFRGLLSVLVGVVVLIGGTYLLVATNTGTRSGFLISMAGLFGWMFLMGIIWTIYGIGWRGPIPTWHLKEMNVDHAADSDDGLLFSEIEEAHALARVDLGADGIDDVDVAQITALENSRDIDLGEWRYLTASDGIRGEAQATAEQLLVSEHVFDGGDYLTLQFGGFVRDGKPVFNEDGKEMGFLEEQVARVGHFVNETFLHPFHGEELIVIQAQGTVSKPSFPGQAPPIPELDPEAKLVSVIMERDRGGPIPGIISGLRFTPAMFTIFNGLLFAVLAWALHNRDRRQDEIRAAVAS